MWGGAKLILSKAKIISRYQQSTTPYALWRPQSQLLPAKYFQNRINYLTSLQKDWLWRVHRSKLNLEVSIIIAIVSNGVLSIFINVLLIYLQIIIQFDW